MLLAALIWGTTFVAQQLGMANVGPLTFTGARFLIGAVFVMPLAIREFVRLKEHGIVFDRRDLRDWCGLGILLFLGALFQQIGIAGTTVSNAGFLTALYVPLVPLLAWIVDRHRPHPVVWPATIGSFIGTFFLSGGKFETLTAGDWWVIASTLFWAAHLLWVGRVAARKGAPILVAFTQFVVCGTLASILAGLYEPVTVAGFKAGLPSILYGGLLSVGVAFTLQVVAQRYARPVEATLLLSSEILFAAIAAALYLGERLSTIQMAGGGLIFFCIVVVQVLPLFERGSRARELTPCQIDGEIRV
jgi:drug/metabolite transporter (DMT)-like permease